MYSRLRLLHTNRYRFIAKAICILSACVALTDCSKRIYTVQRLPIDESYIPHIDNLPRPPLFIAREEMRAVWLTTIYGLDWPKQPAKSQADQERQRRDLCVILDRLRNDGFNTVFLQVRLRGDLIYPSKYEPFATVLTGSRQSPDYDPLAFAIEACHSRGLSLHAWMTTFPLGAATGDGGTIRTKQPEWCIRHRGEWQLNPGEPAVRDYIASIVRELATNYPQLDGIHLDYVRYPDFAHTFADSETYRRYGQGQNKEQWRRDNITDLMRRIRKVAMQTNPRLQISCATLGKLRKLPAYPQIGWTAYEDVYQDPIQWAKDGSVDFIVPMMYYRDLHFRPFLADWQTELPLIPIIPGLGVYRVDEGKDPWPPEVIAQQIQEARSLGFPGICLYREGNITANKELHRVVRKSFSSPALPVRFGNLSKSRT